MIRGGLNHEDTKDTKSGSNRNEAFNHRGTEDTEIRVRGAEGAEQTGKFILRRVQRIGSEL